MAPGQAFEDSFRIELRVASSIFQAGLFCRCDVPSLSLDVSFAVTPSLVVLAGLPPVIDPRTQILNTEGYIVDIPIVGHVTEAYLVLEGPGIVPEPQSWLLIACGTVALVVAHARRSEWRERRRIAAIGWISATICVHLRLYSSSVPVDYARAAAT